MGESLEKVDHSGLRREQGDSNPILSGRLPQQHVSVDQQSRSRHTVDRQVEGGVSAFGSPFSDDPGAR